MRTAVEIMREVIAQMEGVSECPHYSGRGMYGRDCFAISGTIAQCQMAIGEALKLDSQEVFDEACVCGESDEEMAKRDAHLSQHHKNIEALVDFSWDNMGHDIVFYWKSLKSDPPDIVITNGGGAIVRVGKEYAEGFFACHVRWAGAEEFEECDFSLADLEDNWPGISEELANRPK